MKAFLPLVLLAGCATATSPPAGKQAARSAAEFQAIIAAPDRTQQDRDADLSRKPIEMLAFMRVEAGQRAAELCAGGGYTTELLARAVGPTGRVYGQNPDKVLKIFAQKPWTERLARPALANVVRVDRELEDPFPPEARDLDLVAMVLFYHDTYWFGTDRARMNQAIFRALKPGGAFVVIDHSARPGTGSADTKSLHRVEEALVRQELEASGFKFDGAADFLRNPSDTRDWNVFSHRGTTDRFALRFIKPTR